VKLSPAQTKLLAKVRKVAAEGSSFGDTRYAVQNRQFATAEVLIREGLVTITTRDGDMTLHLSPVEG